MKKILIACAVLVLSAALTPLSYASPGVYSNDYQTRSCEERGHHKNVTNVRPVFIPGKLPKQWLDPGASWTYKANTSTSVTGTISGEMSAQFLSIAQAKVSSSLATTNQVTVSQEWSWTNTSNSTKWVQLGARGYEMDFESYDVIPPCRIVNVKYHGHAKLPTNETWIRHS